MAEAKLGRLCPLSRVKLLLESLDVRFSMRGGGGVNFFVAEGADPRAWICGDVGFQLCLASVSDGGVGGASCVEKTVVTSEESASTLVGSML